MIHRRRAPMIKFTTCPRCGKPTATTTHPRRGTEYIYAKYAGICKACITPEEENEIIHTQANAILTACKTI